MVYGHTSTLVRDKSLRRADSLSLRKTINQDRAITFRNIQIEVKHAGLWPYSNRATCALGSR
jgi:hypothetical protein